MSKYKLTKETAEYLGRTLYRIEATSDFGSVQKGEKGGFVEKVENLSEDGTAWVSGNARVYGDAQVSDNAQVYGNARVSDNAWVSGNARVSAKARFTKGWFIGGDDSGKIAEITEQTGSTYWKKQYVLGEYEIKPIEEPSLVGQTATVEIGGKTYIATIQEAI